MCRSKWYQLNFYFQCFNDKWIGWLFKTGKVSESVFKQSIFKCCYKLAKGWLWDSLSFTERKLLHSILHFSTITSCFAL